ncbi:hypothetical protein BKA10_000723 [Microbacterium invictum]|uniref:Uncharacterized protein n=1 Tax=Microbacterium invictum TaxID=515415 RepID=A0AA40VKY8_9MICO|nr:hypothetical protein [Microbacterium invictum]
MGEARATLFGRRGRPGEQSIRVTRDGLRVSEQRAHGIRLLSQIEDAVALDLLQAETVAGQQPGMDVFGDGSEPGGRRESRPGRVGSMDGVGLHAAPAEVLSLGQQHLHERLLDAPAAVFGQHAQVELELGGPGFGRCGQLQCAHRSAAPPRHEPPNQAVGLVLPRGQQLGCRPPQMVHAQVALQGGVDHVHHRPQVGGLGRIECGRDRDGRDDQLVEIEVEVEAHASTFFHPALYDAGANPIASLMSSMGRFSSALKVITRGESGAISACQVFSPAHLTSMPSR